MDRGGKIFSQNYKIMKRIFLFLAMAVCTVSCCIPCFLASPLIGDLENYTWRLVEFQGTAIRNSNITMRFDPNEKMVYGTADCNNFFGGYVLYDDFLHNIKFQNMGSTRKYCPNSELEELFVSSLARVVDVKMEGDNMLFIDDRGELLSILTKDMVTVNYDNRRYEPSRNDRYRR